MYNRLFRNVWSTEGSASGQTTFNLPWPSGQITFSNDTSGRNMELYLGGSAFVTSRTRMTIAGNETVSFEFGTKEITISGAGDANAYRLWVLG